MASNWNNVVPSAEWQIPTDLSKYIEFEPSSTHTVELATINPSSSDIEYKEYYDTYIVCRKNA